MSNEQEVKGTVRRLLRTENLGVLATVGEGQPLCSLMTFAATEDMRRIIFATRRDTAKFRNLLENPRVSMLIDSRVRAGEDFTRTVAITITGEATETAGRLRDELAHVLLEKHPHLRDFVSAGESAVVAVEVERCYLVSGFCTGGEEEVTL